MAGIVKAECGGELRRFSMGTDATLEALNDKLRELFPRLKEMQFDIYYRDPEGDAIRIGSDDELKHAWTTCGEESVLRVMIQCASCASCGGEPRRSASGHLVASPMDVWGGFGGMMDPFTSSFDSLFRVFDEPFYGKQWWLPWERRQLSLKQREEQLRHQREVEEKLRKEHEEKQKRVDEFFRKEAESFRQMMEKQREEAEAAEKTGEVVKKTPKGTVVVARPKAHFTPFGSYEPVHRSGPGWSSTSWGPVGYELYYHYPGEEEETEQIKEDTEEAPQQKTEEKDEKME